MDSKALIESIKEPLRYILIAVVSYILTGTVLNNIVMYLFGEGIDPTTQILIVGMMTAFFRGIDKYLHEIGKETNNVELAKGLTRF